VSRPLVSVAPPGVLVAGEGDGRRLDVAAGGGSGGWSLRNLSCREMRVAGLRHRDGEVVCAGELCGGWVVYYFYSGVAGLARGDRGQEAALHRAFRDEEPVLRARGLRVVGVGSETPRNQVRAIANHGICHDMLIDPDAELAGVLGLPSFRLAGRVRFRRLVLVTLERRIEHVFFPLAVPARAPSQVLAWLALQSLSPDSVA
jgi:peroxiredoxin